MPWLCRVNQNNMKIQAGRPQGPQGAGALLWKFVKHNLHETFSECLYHEGIYIPDLTNIAVISDPDYDADGKQLNWLYKQWCPNVLCLLVLYHRCFPTTESVVWRFTSVYVMIGVRHTKIANQRNLCNCELTSRHSWCTDTKMPFLRRPVHDDVVCHQTAWVCCEFDFIDNLRILGKYEYT